MAETPPPVTPSIEQQRQGFVSPTASSGDEWLAVKVYTGRSSPRPTFDSDQTGSWAVPGSVEYEKDANGYPVMMTDYTGKQVPKPVMDFETVTAGQLADQWFTMDGVDRNRYKDTFILMGLINPQRATDQDYSQIWVSYVKQLASYAAANPNNKITIGDLLDADLKKKEQQDPGLSELMRTGKRTTTRTSTNIQKSSNLDARALMDAAARSLLGRKATAEESAKLLSIVNQIEAENPEVTTSTQEEDMYGTVLSQNSTTTGGVSAGAREQVAREQAEANPEFGAYQAATTYMGSLMDMVYGRGY